MRQVYEVELRVRADNSWAISAQQRFRDALASAEPGDPVPTAEAIGGSGAGELVLRWAELPADGAWPATRAAIEAAEELLPELGGVPFIRVRADLLDVDAARAQRRSG